MNRLTVKQLQFINESLAKLLNIESKLVDFKLLEYISNTPYELEKGGDFYVYKSVVDKAARMVVLFSENKPFANLNIKTGIIAAITMLEINGIYLCYEQSELSAFITMQKTGMSYKAVRIWLMNHINKQMTHKLPFCLS